MRRSIIAATLAVSFAASALTATSANASTTINGGGSSFQANFEAACRTAYNASQSTTSITYDGTLGSGTGMTNFKDGTFNFAGTDGPDTTKVPSGETAVVVPIAAAPIAIAYNVKGKNGKKISTLRLNATVLSGIFKGSITKWDDAAIVKLNPSIKKQLPATAIRVAYRAAGSGTTKNLTQYFVATAAADGWTATKDFIASANTAKPANGVSSANSDEMVRNIKGTNGTIGYADLPDTNGSGLKLAALKNAQGNFVKPSAASGKKFVAAISADKFQASGTVTGFITGTDATAMFTQKIKNAYQLTAVTYIQASKKTSANNSLVKDYVLYAVNKCQGKGGYSALAGAALSLAKSQAGLISSN